MLYCPTMGNGEILFAEINYIYAIITWVCYKYMLVTISNSSGLCVTLQHTGYGRYVWVQFHMCSYRLIHLSGIYKNVI